jgi:hypothetical protein
MALGLGLFFAAACGEDLAPTGITGSGTLVVLAEVGGWAIPGTTFGLTGPTGATTLVSDGSGVATANGVVPGDYMIVVQESDSDARFDTQPIQVRVRAESADTAVLTGVFDTGRFEQVAVGNAVICALNESGNPYCWGLGEAGELGTGSVGRSALPLRARAPEPLTDLVAGSLHMCGLGVSGAAYCWGLNAAGRLGTGTGSSEAPFIALPTPVAGGVQFSSLEAGGGFACGLEVGSGRAWCWGSGSVGQLGDGSRSGSPVPVAVDTDERFVELSIGDAWAGSSSVAGRTADGRVFVWGASPGNGDSWLAYSGVSPVQVPLPGPATSATTLCALVDSGVVCWPDLSGEVPMEVSDVLLLTAEAGVRSYTTTPLDPAFFLGGMHCRVAAAGYDCTESWAFELPLLDLDGEVVTQMSSFGRGGCAVTDVGRVWCWRGDFFIAQLAAGPGAA